MSFVGVGTPSLTVQPRPSGGGGVPPGNPNSIAFYNPLGTTITTDASLTAFPLDPFGRPQIWDKRVGGAGAVYRNGSWTVDGDPTDVVGDGIVLYGPAPNGLFDGLNGTIGRSKSSRFAIRMIQAGVDIGNAFRVDAENPAPLWLVATVYIAGAVVRYQNTYYTSLVGGNVGNVPPTPPALSAFWVQTDSAGGLYLKDNAGAKPFAVDRSTGSFLTLGTFNLAAQAGDPVAVPATGFVYTKVVTGITQLFYEDSAGNVYQLTPRTIVDSFKFSGSMTGTPVVLKARFLGDVPNSAFVAAVEYPATGPSGNATLRVKPSANTLTAATNFRVFVNGIVSGLVVVIPAAGPPLVVVTA
ncbi:MAG: hypothetical protein MUQ56_12670, partial [Thermoleophilia bacterium]|nr:hypothetical protein [Thermoleophilia bacterium]